MSTIPTTANFIAANTEAQQKVYFQSWLEACGQLPGGSPAVDMTILTGNITPAAGTNTYKVDTESATATDDLSSINITNLPDGSEIKLTAKLNTRAVTLKHNVGTSGKVVTLLAKDILLREGVFVSLKRYGTTWYEFGGGVVEKATSAEVVAGTDDAKYVTPLGVAGAITANVTGTSVGTPVTFTASGSYVATTSAAIVEVCGGGGGGGGGGYVSRGASGGTGGASSVAGIIAPGGGGGSGTGVGGAAGTLTTGVNNTLSAWYKGVAGGNAAGGNAGSGGASAHHNDKGAGGAGAAGSNYGGGGGGSSPTKTAIVTLIKGTSYPVVVGAAGAGGTGGTANSVAEKGVAGIVGEVVIIPIG